MEKRRFIIISIILALSATWILAESRGAVISFLIGDIQVRRNKAKITLGQGDSPVNGDVFRIGENSMVELSIIGKNEKIKINGPQVFLFNIDKLKSNVQSGTRLASLLKKISKSTDHYYPRTIVSAVRKKGAQTDKKNKEGRKKITDAIDRYKEGKYEESWKLLDEVEKLGALKIETRLVVSFYRAGIYFERMEYDKALSLYSRLGKTGYSKFRHREESLGRAIICAAYTGETEKFANLIEEYKTEYGEEGSYWGTIKELRKEL
jgi:hypothetical protein